MAPMLKIVCRNKGGNKETSLEDTAVIEVKNDGGLDKEDNSSGIVILGLKSN